MISMKISAVGNSLGVILPKEALAKLNAGKGDVLYLTEMPGGDFRLSTLDADVAEAVRIGESIMDRYRDTLRALAR